jgi:hypothetical protein
MEVLDLFNFELKFLKEFFEWFNFEIIPKGGSSLFELLK